MQPHVSGRVLAVASGKGGVGKTTIAVGLAWTLAQITRSSRIALVDGDPQAGATSALGLTPPDAPLRAPAEGVAGLLVQRASRTLALARAVELEHWLRTVIVRADATIVDLSPALTDAMHAATLRCAPSVVVAARCDAMGLPNVRELVGLLRRAQCRHLIVPTFSSHTRVSRDAERCLRDEFGTSVASTTFPLDTRAAEAPIAHQPLPAYAPQSRAAVALREIVIELLARQLVVGPVEAGALR
ncbi:MAG: ParA family protein [Gemmatimonadaceae bacterium]|jgi:chromosome partitioning protein|nr:ParA family protein [Gemmatimonadaceae bacterium]